MAEWVVQTMLATQQVLISIMTPSCTSQWVHGVLTAWPAVKRVPSVRDGLLKSPFYDQLIADSSSVFNTIDPDVLRTPQVQATPLKVFLPRIGAKMRLAFRRISLRTGR